MRELLDIKGFKEGTTEGFKRKLIQIADRNGLNPSYLAGVMSFETGGTFSPKIKNPGSSATGLIQFMNSTAEHLGTSTAALAKMTAEEQLDYVEKYYQGIIKWAGPIKTVGDHYLAVFAPSGVGKDAANPLYVSPAQSYQANKALDKSGDGTITNDDATRIVRRIVETAETKPRIIVADAPGEDGRGGPGLIATFMAFMVGLFGLSRFRSNTVRASQKK